MVTASESSLAKFDGGMVSRMCEYGTVKIDTADELGIRIAEARELAGMTQAELATMSDLGRTVIAKIEAGTRKVGAVELVRLAEALRRPVDWFFVESPPAVVSRRSDSNIRGLSALLDARVDWIARDIAYLHQLDELPKHERFVLPPPESVDGAAAAAGELRRHLNLPDGPLHHLQALAERLGLFAFSLDIGADGGDAAYVAVEDAGVAVINGKMDPGRRRFNLAHELGHHVFQDAYAPEIGLSPQDDTERLINAFAIHLLLPLGDARSLVEEFAPDVRLAAVAAGVRFRLSWTAVCAQVRNAGLADAGAYEDLAAQPPTRVDFLELGERWQPELEAPAVPPKYGRRVLSAYRRRKLTAERAAELLWDTLSVVELPDQVELSAETYRREFGSEE
ncbi:MAG: XRE family transcriptional regulator [Acidimicrobiaceae bacterium]|nr:XRE family transcriptional regulator [Acidimicrobiaceae bacterium]